MRRPSTTPPVPPGLLSLTALLWAVAWLTAGIWIIAGPGPALLTAGILGAAALLAADQIISSGGRL